MSNIQVAAYGSWKSLITADLITSGTIGLSMPLIDGHDFYWLERRPTEGGRGAPIRRAADGTVTDLLPPPWNVRTRVHEYGGGDYAVKDGILYFTDFRDQRLYRVLPGNAPEPLTPEGKRRYADLVIDSSRQRIICVCEDHSPEGQPVNALVSIALDGDHAIRILTGGADFYAAPRLSPDGQSLAWLSWNHPNMPWDGTELWVSKLDAAGDIKEPQLIAGGKQESISQPVWSPDGELYFVSDRTGWWNLYRARAGQIEAICDRQAEFSLPQWVFGLSTYGFLTSQSMLCAFIEQGVSKLAQLDLATGTLTPLDFPYTVIQSVQVTREHVLLQVASASEPTSLVAFDPQSGQWQVLRGSSSLNVDLQDISRPETLEFPTENGLTAHAFYYPPYNPRYRAPEGELPPLLVMSHGGPTAATNVSLNMGTQFWTSRGFGVLDVNYGGSTGYGRAYRERLNGQMGVVDVQDCINGALFLARSGRADGKRLAIRGGSAGGYTTLCALTFHDVFHAGASYFGISDIEVIALETHKFESRYIDTLIGPYPESRDLYHQRSPIHFIDQIRCPVIFFQGLEDPIVPPNQAELMVEALRAKKVPVAYVPVEGESHGFRQAANIKRTLENEFSFYAQVFGFSPADPMEPVTIENFPADKP